MLFTRKTYWNVLQKKEIAVVILLFFKKGHAVRVLSLLISLFKAMSTKKAQIFLGM